MEEFAESKWSKIDLRPKGNHVELSLCVENDIFVGGFRNEHALNLDVQTLIGYHLFGLDVDVGEAENVLQLGQGH